MFLRAQIYDLAQVRSGCRVILVLTCSWLSEDRVSPSVQVFRQTPHAPPHPLWVFHPLLVAELVEALMFSSRSEPEQLVLLKLVHESGHVLLPAAGRGRQAGQVRGQVQRVSSREEESVQVFGLSSGQLSALLHLLLREAAFTKLDHT